MAFHFKQGDRPLPGYTIQRGIGTGGFGEVYYATSDGGKEVALKYLRDNPQVELRGATHCLNLKSPYLVALHDIKQSPDGEFFVIMEYVNGPTLRDLMNAEPAGLGSQKAAYFLREIGKGLAYLHDRGIVHRDLKPGNIFYEDGYVKIGDYGLAKIMAASQHSGQTMSVGTVHYMAPEVGSGNYDRTIDVYALGVLLYEMLLGRVPFSGASMGEVLMKHLTAQPEVEELPEPFPHVIRKALAKDPNDRYQTVTEMVSELFEIEDLSRSVAAFEPASLSTIAARVARDVHVTLTAAGSAHAGHAAGPFGTGSSNVGQAAPPPIIDPSTDDRAGDDAIRPAGGRIRRRVGRVASRLDESLLGREVAAMARRPRNSAESITLAVIICAGISAAVMALKGEDPSYAVAVCTHCFAIIGGILFAYRQSSSRMESAPYDTTEGFVFAYRGSRRRRRVVEGAPQSRRHQRRWTHRALSVVFVAMAMGLMNAIARKNGWAGGDSRHWIGAIVLAMIFCDWHGRVLAGQQGRVSLRSALMAGLFGFVVGNLVGHGDWLPISAMLAAASLSIQTLAGAWWMRKDVEAEPATAGIGVETASSSEASDPPWRRMWNTMTAAQRSSRRVAVSRDGAVGEPQDHGEVHAGAHRYVSASETHERFPHRELRSSGARVVWSLLAGLLLFAMIFAFVTPAAMNLRGDEFAAAMVIGVVLANYALFAMWCIFPRYKKGLWRGVFRKMIFFTGTALSAGCGTAMGLFEPKEEAFLAVLGGILFGGIVALFVWFVPIPRYVPSREAKPQDGDENPEIRSARRLQIAGIVSLSMITVVLPTLLATVPERNLDAVLPGALFPLVIFGLVATITGFTRGRILRDKQNIVQLPIRRVFLIDSIEELDSLLERHMSMYGYRLRNRGNLLWQFSRGDWTSQFWQSDIRRWKTDLTLAAYQQPDGNYRITCHLDIDSRFSTPKRARLQRLNSELDDMRDLLGAREVPKPDGGDAL